MLTIRNADLNRNALEIQFRGLGIFEKFYSTAIAQG